MRTPITYTPAGMSGAGVNVAVLALKKGVSVGVDGVSVGTAVAVSTVGTFERVGVVIMIGGLSAEIVGAFVPVPGRRFVFKTKYPATAANPMQSTSTQPMAATTGSLLEPSETFGVLPGRLLGTGEVGVGATSVCSGSPGTQSLPS